MSESERQARRRSRNHGGSASDRLDRAHVQIINCWMYSHMLISIPIADRDRH